LLATLALKATKAATPPFIVIIFFFHILPFDFVVCCFPVLIQPDTS